MLDGNIMINGLVSPDDTDTISELVEAAQHENETRTLNLGFKTIELPPSNKETPPPKKKLKLM